MRLIQIVSLIDEPWHTRRHPFVALGGVALAILVAAMSLGGLFLPATYARETANWTTQAIAQDWFDLVIAVPALVASAWWAARGRARGWLVYGGVLLFTVYTAIIYAFAVHLNSLFLVYCAALGLSLYGLIHAAAHCSNVSINERAPRRVAGGFLIAVGVAFELLWLAQLIPAAVNDTVPAELAATGLLTNPVHVIDLSFILPLHIVAGVALWRRSRLAWIAPIVLVFGALMAASIAFLTAFVAITPVTFAMGLVSLASLYLATRVLCTVREYAAA